MTKKEKFLEQLNEAFAKNDIEFIIKNVTDDIVWTVVNNFTVNGKEQFNEAMEKMKSDEPFQLKIKNIITHGDSAAVNGVMKTPEGKRYAFCDVYKFSGFKNPKVKRMTSYVIELKQK